jgi:hypothetical protein
MEELVYIHFFLTSALVEDEKWASPLRSFTPGERATGTHWTGSWMGPIAGLDDFFFLLFYKKIVCCKILQARREVETKKSHNMTYRKTTKAETKQRF